MTRSDFWQEAAMEAMDNDEVLEARMVFSETIFSRSEKSFRLTSKFSTMASITKSESESDFNSFT